MTFGEVDRKSARLAARLLAAGVGKGTRLGVLYPNGGAWPSPGWRRRGSAPSQFPSQRLLPALSSHACCGTPTSTPS